VPLTGPVAEDTPAGTVRTEGVDLGEDAVEHERRDWCPVAGEVIHPPAGVPTCPACGAPLPASDGPDSPVSPTDIEARIEALAVSDRWKSRFRTIAHLKALPGGVQANLRTVGRKERTAVQFNVMGFLFGFLYYFFKRMHRRAFVGMGITFLYLAAATLVEARLGVTFPLSIYWVPGAVAVSMLANHDYYATLVEGRTMWPFLRRLDGPAASAGAMIAGAAVLLFTVASTYRATIGDVESALEQDLKDRFQIEAVATCPPSASLEPGSTFVCEVDADGESMQVHVIMRSGDTFDWSIDEGLSNA
jgi:hypothetical protein